MAVSMLTEHVPAIPWSANRHIATNLVERVSRYLLAAPPHRLGREPSSPTASSRNVPKRSLRSSQLEQSLFERLRVFGLKCRVGRRHDGQNWIYRRLTGLTIAVRETPREPLDGSDQPSCPFIGGQIPLSP
jgi:hypothetical protein